MIFTPNGTDINVSNWFYGFETWLFGGLPFLLLLKGISFIVPMWVIQKVLLFCTLFLAGFSAHLLSPAKNQVGKYFAGLIYMLNPFVYVRFMAGQWLLLLGYAVMPFAIRTIFSFFKEPNLKRALRMTLLLTLVGMFSSHILILVLFVFIVIFVVKLIPTSSRLTTFINLTKYTAIAASIFFLINTYWILPALISKSILSQIGTEDLIVFSAKNWSGAPSLLFGLASLHGFWREGYRYISDIVPGWYLIYIFILFLTIYGLVNKYNEKEIGHHVKTFMVLAIISLVLATGISTPYFSDLYTFLFDKVVIFKGFRDSQKFVVLLALAYSYLGGLGVDEIFQQLKPKYTIMKRAAFSLVFGVLAVTTPLVYSTNMLLGFNHQLTITQYPSEWNEVNIFLNRQGGDFKVLFFPWHSYMDFNWSRGRLLNPAASFFDRSVIQGENIEVGDIETQSINPEQHYIQFLLENNKEIHNWGELIAPLNVRYIILAKESNLTNYDFLYRQLDLTVVLDNSRIVLFQNQHPTAKLYLTNGTSWISDWEAMLSAYSRESDIMNQAIFLGQTHCRLVLGL